MMMRRGYNFGSLWDEMARMNKEMNRFFGHTESVSRTGVFPPVNVYDDGESFVVTAEIPGIDPEALEIEATQDSLTIKGERNPKVGEEGESFHRKEREYGTFSRSLNLRQPVDPDKIRAEYNQGVLEVRLPKAAEAIPRKVPVSA